MTFSFACGSLLPFFCIGTDSIGIDSIFVDSLLSRPLNLLVLGASMIGSAGVGTNRLSLGAEGAESSIGMSTVSVISSETASFSGGVS